MLAAVLRIDAGHIQEPIGAYRSNSAVRLSSGTIRPSPLVQGIAIASPTSSADVNIQSQEWLELVEH